MKNSVCLFNQILSVALQENIGRNMVVVGLLQLLLFVKSNGGMDVVCGLLNGWIDDGPYAL